MPFKSKQNWCSVEKLALRQWWENGNRKAHWQHNPGGQLDMCLLNLTCIPLAEKFHFEEIHPAETVTPT